MNTMLRAKLEEAASSLLRTMIGDEHFLVIDEAQRVKNIGLCIKLITDNISRPVVSQISNKLMERKHGL